MTIMLDDREVVAYAKGGLEVFRGKLSDFPAEIIAAAAAYAIHKKCQDASGGADTTETAAKEAAAKVIEALKAGTWAQRGGGTRAGNEEDFVLSRLVAYIKAQAKKANASAPSDEDARATAAAIMKSGKPKAQVLCAQYRAEWAAKSTSIGDLI